MADCVHVPVLVLSKGIVSWPPEGGGHSAGGVAVGLAGAATSDGFLPSWQLAGAAVAADGYGLIKMHCLMQIMNYISW